MGKQNINIVSCVCVCKDCTQLYIYNLMLCKRENIPTLLLIARVCFMFYVYIYAERYGTFNMPYLPFYSFFFVRCLNCVDKWATRISAAYTDENHCSRFIQQPNPP